jgi:subtilisin family serine protease
MTKASYSPINENYLSLRPAIALGKNREKLGADLWDDKLSGTIQFRDPIEVVTPNFSTVEDVPLLLENDLAGSLKVKQLQSNHQSVNLNNNLIGAPEVLNTPLHELKQDSKAKLTVDGQDIEIAQEPGINLAFDRIGLTQLRNDQQFQGIDGSGMTVVVIDTGLDASHPLIGGNFTGFADFANSGAFTTDPAAAFDSGSHGTHVTGTVGATDPNIGVAPDVNIISLKFFDGTVPNPGEVALQWVEANRQQFNIVAVNFSLGAGSFTSRDQATGDNIFDEVGRLEQAGVTIVSAAGNSYESNPQPGVMAPGIFSSLVVGSVSKEDDTISDFSQRLDASNMIFAPGENITSTVPGGELRDASGTSAA